LVSLSLSLSLLLNWSYWLKIFDFDYGMSSNFMTHLEFYDKYDDPFHEILYYCLLLLKDRNLQWPLIFCFCSLLVVFIMMIDFLEYIIV
jgi:hypothetical protein